MNKEFVHSWLDEHQSELIRAMQGSVAFQSVKSEAAPNAKVRELEAKIGNGGAIVAYDDGAVWLTKGSPWCQSLNDDTSPTIKRRYLNVYRSELATI